MKRKLRSGMSVGRVYLDRAVGGLALLALHEAGSLQGHVDALAERLRVARRARNLRELVDQQLDLLPESRNRFRHDHHVRLELWRGVVRDVRDVGRALQRS